MPSNTTEYSKRYWRENKERLKELSKRKRQKKNAEYKPMPEKYISNSPECAAIVMLLTRAQRVSGLPMSEFIKGFRGVDKMTGWKEIRETYQNWRDTDEGQRLIGDR